MDRHKESMVGRLLDDRYRIESLLGRGGHAATYLARDAKLRRRVAIKIPRPEVLAAAGFRRRFAREIEQLIRLDHPTIMKVFDAADLDGAPCAVFQYLSGGSLSERLEAAGGWMPPAEVCAWLPRVAEALDFIHGRGVVHRDVKPGNILFDEHDNAFLADFGIVKALGAPGETGSGGPADTVIGSPPYMAPEVGAPGEAVGPATDQYCLGATVYHALSGQFPHELPERDSAERSPLKILVAKATQPPRDLVEVAAYVSPGVHMAVMRAIARDPDRRFSSCAAFAEAFAERHDAPPAVWLGSRDEVILENPVGPMCLLDPEATREIRPDAEPETEGDPTPTEVAEAPATSAGRLLGRGLVEAVIGAAALAAAVPAFIESRGIGVPNVGASGLYGFLALYVARALGSYRGVGGWLALLPWLVELSALGSPGFELVLAWVAGGVLGDRTAVRVWPRPGSRLSIARWVGWESPAAAGAHRRSWPVAAVAGGCAAYLVLSVGHFLSTPRSGAELLQELREVQRLQRSFFEATGRYGTKKQLGYVEPGWIYVGVALPGSSPPRGWTARAAFRDGTPGATGVTCVAYGGSVEAGSLPPLDPDDRTTAPAAPWTPVCSGP